MSTGHNQTPDFLAPLPKTTRSVPLPSRGIPYTGGPAAEGRLTLAAMTMVEENLMSTPRTLSGEDGINAALKACIQESLDLNHLLTADKFFLFLMLRAVTYGSDYTFNWNCTAILPVGPKAGDFCGFRNRSTVMIPDQFEVKQLADEDTEPFMITLPDSGKDIGFRLARVRDEKSTEKYEREDDGDDRVAGKATIRHHAIRSLEAFQLSQLLTHVDGNELTEDINRDDVMRWLLSLSSRDIAVYRNKLNYFTPGIDTSLKLACSACGFKHDMDLPLTSEFFRPEFAIDPESVADEVRPDAPPQSELRGTAQDSAGGTPLVLREIDGASEGGGRDEEAGTRNPSAGGRGIHRESDVSAG